MAVTSFDAGDLSPLFTTSVTDPTGDAVLNFDLTDASPYTVFGNSTGSTADPSYFAPTLASALFANQGTTTTVLHGNASGNPSWGAVNMANDVTGVLAIANGGTGSTAGAILNQTASPQTAGFSITGNGTLGGTLAVTTKANIGSPSGTTGALNTNQDGIWSFRNSDANRYIRFNTSGTFNDFLSTGVALVINYGFAVTAQNVNFFGGSTSHLGIVSIGSNTATNARLNVKGSTTNSSAYSLRLFDSSDNEKFSVRNDGVIVLNGSAIALAGSFTTSGANALTLTTTGTTNVTLPTTGTLATTAGVIQNQTASPQTAGFSINGNGLFTQSVDDTYLGVNISNNNTGAGAGTSMEINAHNAKLRFTQYGDNYSGGSFAAIIADNTQLLIIGGPGVTTQNLSLRGSSSSSSTLGAPTTGHYTHLLPEFGGTFTMDAGTSTLTNKTITSASNTITLANLTATDATLTFSGTYTGGTARTIGLTLSNPNTWTGLQTMSFPGGGTTVADGLLLTNTMTAANNAQQYSPALKLTGQAWNTGGGASEANEWRIWNVPVQAATPTGLLTFGFSRAGGAFSGNVMTLTSDGNLTALGTLTTADPTTGSGPAWKLGTYKTAGVTLDTGNYIEVEIGGTIRKLAIVT